MSEHSEQQAVFEWAALMEGQHPELALLFAIPNAGKRSYGAAKWMKAEGLRAGIPDIFLAHPVTDYSTDYDICGLFIEMKIGKNKPTAEQEWWIEALNEEGYRAEVCYSADEAIRTIKDYLGIVE